MLFMLLTAAIIVAIARDGLRGKCLLISGMHVDDSISLINCIWLVCRRYVGDVLLAYADLLHGMRRKKTGPIGATHISFQ